MTTEFKSILIAGLVAGAALCANAQTTVASPANTAHGPAASGPGSHHRMDPAKLDAKVAKHLAELKAKLKITPAQEGAWNAFAAAMKPPARGEHTRPDPAEMERLTVPQRIEKMQALRTQHMATRQAQQEKREDAIKAFYATLDNDQKSAMDAAHSQMMKRWGDRKGMGHHGPNH